jgi:hypothetical protein
MKNYFLYNFHLWRLLNDNQLSWFHLKHGYWYDVDTAFLSWYKTGLLGKTPTPHFIAFLKTEVQDITPSEALAFILAGQVN